MKAKIRDTELFFDVLGEQLEYTAEDVREKPVLFCLHGGPGGDHSVFKKYCSELQSDVQLIMMDHRGSGRSQRGLTSSYTLDNNVDDVEALRKYLGLEKIIVYGHSYGGTVAQAYALKYPDNLEKLILGVTVSDAHFYPLARKNLQARGTTAQIAWGEILFDSGFNSNAQLREFFKEMASMYSNKAREQGVDVKAFESMLVSYECINQGFLGFLKELSFTSELHNIQCPTLVFAGRDDWICPPEMSEIIANEIPNSHLVIFENSGHSVPIDEPEAYLKMLRDFIRTA